MPYYELLIHLRNRDDEVETGGEDTAEITTKNGDRYVRSNEGTRWEPKWRWNRF